MMYRISYDEKHIDVECHSVQHAARIAAAIVDAGPYRLVRESPKSGRICNQFGTLASYGLVPS